MRLVLAVLLMGLPGISASAADRPPEVQRLLGAARLHGSAVVDFLTLPIYQAQLWTPSRQGFRATGQFALSLTYHRGFRASTLARSSVEEIARVEGTTSDRFADLQQLLEGCFDNVRAGDRITGAARGADAVTFFVNGRQSCEAGYPDLRQRFFGIWLGQDTRDPEATAQLLGTQQ